MKRSEQDSLGTDIIGPPVLVKKHFHPPLGFNITSCCSVIVGPPCWKVLYSVPAWTLDMSPGQHVWDRVANTEHDLQADRTWCEADAPRWLDHPTVAQIVCLRELGLLCVRSADKNKMSINMSP